MAGSRFVVIGLAKVRTPWFATTSSWANSASVPVEFVKCVSASEVRARLASGRAISAILVDAGAQGVDRDLLAAARDIGAASIVVADLRFPGDWPSLGASAVLEPTFDREALLECLDNHAAMVATRRSSTATDATALNSGVSDISPRWCAPLVAVMGSPGAGTSTVAMAAAQALAKRPANRDAVVLADLCLRGDLAMYHDPGDVVPGLSELVDTHRRSALSPSQVRELCWRIDSRGYDLLLGLRRPRDWSALRPRAFEAALASLRSAYRAVVVDIDSDLDGEQETGSVDLEDRNMMARHAVDAAAVILVVGGPHINGLHGVNRIARDLIDRGCDPRIIRTVINRSRRSPRSRSEITSALHQLGPDDAMAPPLFLPERRTTEAVHRTCGPLSAGLDAPLASLLGAALSRSGSLEDAPVRVERKAG